MPEGRPQISFVIPARNEAPRLPTTLESIRQACPEAEVIIVDGASSDGTADVARRSHARVIHAAPCRGRQCNAGAASARGRLLVFLHADTVLSAGAGPALQRTLDKPDLCIAVFRMAFDDPSPLLRLSAWCARFDLPYTRFGDQGIVIRRAFYDRLGGFRNWTLFDDVDLFCRARAHGPIPRLPATVITSARRFRQHGILRQQLRNLRLLRQFLRGADPEALAAAYFGPEDGPRPDSVRPVARVSRPIAAYEPTSRP
jgi:rSAM/selenodomain-associated transferase 2